MKHRIKQIVAISGFMISITILSCKDKKVTVESNPQETKTTKDLSKDTTEIKQTVLSFYNWYGANWEKLTKYRLYQGENPPYKMNWSEVDRMHQYMRANVPQLGNEFISNQKLFLRQTDSAFKQDVENEIPYNFDYDWYTNSQEDPMYLIDALNSSSSRWKYDVNGDDAMVEIKGKWLDETPDPPGTLMKLAMKKENGTWKISRIGL